jgi:hypothetical protein
VKRSVAFGRTLAGSVAGALVLLLAASPSAQAWGPVVHQHVTAKAIDTLPKPIKEFYKNHRYELPTLAVDAQPVEEGPDRRFAIDRILPFPFLDVPHDEKAVMAKLPAGEPSPGRLPWLIEDAYAKLVEAFKAGDKTRILEASDTLAGLVTDLHNPLAVTRNFDGQLSEQHGLWVRFSEKLPEAMEKDIDLKPDDAHYLDRPDEYIFSMIEAAYVWADNLLYQEDLAHRGKSGYTTIYYDDFKARAGEILNQRLSQAAADVGSYWYSAWTDAGRPELK